MTAPSRPTSAPSNTNGQRMNASDAPTRRMISISSARATTASRIVLTMMNSTISPTMPTMATPAVRTTLVTVSTRWTSASDVEHVAHDGVLAQALGHRVDSSGS